MHPLLKSLEPELARIALSALLVIATFALLSALRHYQTRVQKQKNTEGRPDTALLDQQRKLYVFSKNTAWLVCSLLLVSLWAAHLATTFLSIAAVTGAMIIVSKELVSNLYGYWILTLTRPYKIGDTISIGPIKDSKVININAMSTTVSNPFGLSTSFPNSFLLLQSLTNHSELQPSSYCIHTFSLDLPLSAPIHLIEPIALRIAHEHTSSWTDEANTQIETLETHRQINLPSARPRVLLSSNQDGRSIKLTWRITCPPASALDCEQIILLHTFQQIHAFLTK